MLADHPTDDRFRRGHWFCFARSAGAHLQVLHQSSRCQVLIPRALLEEVEPFESPVAAEPPAQPGAVLPTCSQSSAAGRLAAYFQGVNT